MLIAITGLSGSGKSFVAALLGKRYGAYVINCDLLSHRILNQKSAEIAKTFGMDVLLENNVVSRRVLANTVFNNPEKLEILESILYPEIEKQIKEIIQGCEGKFKHVVIDAPTLSKTNIKNICDLTVITTAPIWLRLIRIKKRDDRTIKEILKRFKNNKINITDYKAPIMTINTLFNPMWKIKGLVDLVIRSHS